MACPVEPTLGPDPVQNASDINTLLAGGDHVRIPKGEWPVRPLLMPSNSRISGCGIGVATLKLEVASVGNWKDTNVIRAEGADSISINDVTLDGNQSNIDFSGLSSKELYRSGMGIQLQGATNSILSNIEIRNCWNDGVFFTLYNDPVVFLPVIPSDCVCDNLIIYDCGKTGIGIDAGQNLTLSNLDIYNIGQDSSFQKWPRAGVDATPRDIPLIILRNINISTTRIRNSGQGILVRADHSTQPADGIVISDLDLSDLKGNQILLVRQVPSVAISNVTCRDFDATTVDASEPVGGLMFDDSVGVVSNINLDGVTYDSGGDELYPVVVVGNESDVQLTNLLVQNCTFGALRVGPPSGSAESCSLSLAEFVFRHLMGVQGAQVISTNASGNVSLSNGLIRDRGNAAQTVNTQTDTKFSGCDFEPGVTGNIFLFGAAAAASHFI